MLTSTVHIAVITPPYSSEPLLLHVRSCVHFLGCVYKHLCQYDPTGFSWYLSGTSGSNWSYGRLCWTMKINLRAEWSKSEASVVKHSHITLQLPYITFIESQWGGLSQLRDMILKRFKGRLVGPFQQCRLIVFLPPNELLHSFPEAPRTTQARETSASEGRNYY